MWVVVSNSNITGVTVWWLPVVLGSGFGGMWWWLVVLVRGFVVWWDVVVLGIGFYCVNLLCCLPIKLTHVDIQWECVPGCGMQVNQI